jgi:hypothetical protein
MYCKTLISVAILAATTLGAGAEGEPADQPTPKPTLADVRHLADEIAGDQSKLESLLARKASRRNAASHRE